MKRTLFLAAALAALAAAQAADGTPYRSLHITQPDNDTTIHDNNGNLDVAVALTPSLDVDAGDRLQLIVDGAVAARSSDARFSLADVPRGTHTLEVDVRDHLGNALIRSAPVVVHMWRASALFPNRRGN